MAFDQSESFFFFLLLVFVSRFWRIVGIYPLQYVCWGCVRLEGPVQGFFSSVASDWRFFLGGGGGIDGCGVELFLPLFSLFVDWLVVRVGYVRHFDYKTIRGLS